MSKLDPEELIQQLAKRILTAFNIEDETQFLENSKKLDEELMRNKITPHLTQWSVSENPVLVGNNFVIIYSWQRDLIKEQPQYQQRKSVVIEPGLGFGRTHATTLLSVELLEKHWKGGHMLDVGTGSGVLTIIAAFLQHNAKIDAFDVSLDVVEHAECNLELNGVLDRVSLKHTDINAYEPFCYDLITANLIPSIFVEIKKDLVKRLKPGGIIIISGFSDQDEASTLVNFDWSPKVSKVENTQTYNMKELFENLGLELIDKVECAFNPKESKIKGNWLALAMRMPK